MDRTQWNSLGLCAGVGLLDLAVQLGCEQLGIDCHPAALCEWDSCAAASLLSRMEETSLEPCPIWGGDLRDFDARPFRGLVDILAAGLPCQPYSVAGKQLGNSDRRSHGDDGDGPIPHFLRIAEECRPAVVFLENVPPWVTGGWFRPVGEKLCRLGYTIEDPLFVAAESVGASHRRERVFVLAHCASTLGARLRSRTTTQLAVARIDGGDVANAEPAKRRRQDTGRGAVWGIATGRTDGELAVAAERGRGELRQSSRSDGFFDRSDEAVANAVRIKRQSGTERWGVWQNGAAMADADEQRSQERSGERGDEREEFSAAERSVFAPGPGADWSGIEPHLWPAIEPGLRVLVDGYPVVVDESRADQLRCAGNAVVPLCASVAFVELMRRVKKSFRA